MPVLVDAIVAQSWEASGSSFEVEADISSILSRHGPGVYTVSVAGKPDTNFVVISEYSFFHNVTPPDTYSGYTASTSP